MNKEKIIEKALLLLPKVNKEIWDKDGDDFLNWLRTFKGKTTSIDFMGLSDTDLDSLYHEKSGWLDEPINEAPDITCRMVTEAVLSECLRRAEK